MAVRVSNAVDAIILCLYNIHFNEEEGWSGMSNKYIVCNVN